jgi:hypothetical protein
MTPSKPAPSVRHLAPATLRVGLGEVMEMHHLCGSKPGLLPGLNINPAWPVFEVSMTDAFESAAPLELCNRVFNEQLEESDEISRRR